MKSKNKLIIAFAAVALAAGAGAGAWWLSPKAAANGAVAAKKEEGPRKPPKYVTLDKVIVMLRRAPGEAEPHYLSADLVLATSDAKEKETKENLPFLRSIAVRTLSAYALPAASAMTVEQYADKLNSAFDATYTRERLEKPFTEVMIGKLIIE